MRVKQRSGGILLILLLLVPVCAYAEDGGLEGVQGPEGFRGIRLGMTLEEVKAGLLADPLFDYRGDPDVSFLPVPEQTLIECRGSSYLDRAYFQFHENRLYIMILALDRSSLDYYTLYTTLTAKYGETSSLSPTDAVWVFPALRLSLEKPLSVKYIDREVFASLQEAGRAEDSLGDLSKERFLEQF
jgi:hypothetical protein